MVRYELMFSGHVDANGMLMFPQPNRLGGSHFHRHGGGATYGNGSSRKLEDHHQKNLQTNIQMSMSISTSTSTFMFKCIKTLQNIWLYIYIYIKIMKIEKANFLIGTFSGINIKTNQLFDVDVHESLYPTTLK